MKVNEGKTEILLFGKDSPNVIINVRGTAVESKDSIKALGIQLDKGLTWKPHVTSLKKKGYENCRWSEDGQKQIKSERSN